MRIDQNSLNLAQAIGQAPQTGDGADKTHRHRAGDGDRVQISDMAAQLSADPERLARLQAAVTSGTYNISANRIASSIIADALQT